MGRAVYRLMLAVVTVLLLAVPALGQSGGPEVSKLLVRPDTVWINGDDSDEVSFEMTAGGLETTAKVYLTFQKAGSTSAMQVELRYHDGLWEGRRTVDGGDVGTWNLVYCSYKAADDFGIIDLDTDRATIETRFIVRESDNPNVLELDIHPETVIVDNDDSKDVYFDAAVNDLDADATVYLTFRKEGSTTELRAELTYDDGIWTGRKTVGEENIGTWKLAACTYKVDDETGSIDVNGDDPDIDTRFTVKEQAAATPPDEDGGGPAVPGKAVLKPKQLRAAVEYGEDGMAEEINLFWRYSAGAAIPQFKVYAGYNAGKMVEIGKVEGRFNCSVDVDDLTKALQAVHKPKGKKHVLLRVASGAGASNVAVVSLTQFKGQAGKGKPNRAGEKP
ncbi:MAG: hypothetical protein QMC81_11685 [Thermoanaerobacterales bacterium]|nr:hypothetical protein [Thermoanaerobacterales bacterium]